MVRVPGLGTAGNLSPSLVPTVTFEPTIGIATGRIDKLGLNFRSFKEPLHKAIKDVMVPSIKANFDEGGRPAWEPLADATLMIRARMGFGGKVLVRTGALRRVASQINIWTISATNAVVRDLPEEVWYGKVQQAGNDPGSDMSHLIRKFNGNVGAAHAERMNQIRIVKEAGGEGVAGMIPARPFLMFQPDDVDKIHTIFHEWLAKKVAESSFGSRLI